MGSVAILFLCSIAVDVARVEGILKADKPMVLAQVSDSIDLKCCCNTTGETLHYKWMKHHRANTTIHVNFSVSEPQEVEQLSWWCGHLPIHSVQLGDAGLYRCLFNGSSSFYTHGTYLQVFKPQEKMLNFSESHKNNILIAEGILLFLCVVVPSAALLCQSKKGHEMEKKKKNKEEENIYQGLNIDDCCSTYDQIEHFHVEGPYEDAEHIMEFELEKP